MDVCFRIKAMYGPLVDCLGMVSPAKSASAYTTSVSCDASSPQNASKLTSAVECR